jgi:hypothetical protein
MMTLLILLAGIGFLAWKFVPVSTVQTWAQGIISNVTVPTQPVQKTGQIKIFSDPEGATVFDENEKYIGETQTAVLTYPVGTALKFVLRKNGYQEMLLEHTVEESSEPYLLGGSLKIYSPPRIGESWSDHLGIRYLPEDEMHVSKDYLPERVWQSYLNAEKRPAEVGQIIEISQNGKPSRIVITSASEAELFCRWHQRGATPSYLTNDQEILPRIESSFDHPNLNDEARAKNFKPYRVIVRQVPYGSIELVTLPEGVEVYVNDESRGRITGSTLLEKIRPGPLQTNSIRST